MAKTIAICNQKGGVGKSTTAVNVGAYLALSGNRTLLVDLDPQGNATTSCGIIRATLKKTVYEALVDGLQIEETIVASAVERLDLVPSSYGLAETDQKISSTSERETILKKIFEDIKNKYDVILIDCPPSLGLLTINALVAADCALIPVQCEYLSLEGLTALVQTIDRIKSLWNPHLQIAGIVLTMVDFRVNLTREVQEDVRQFFKEIVCNTLIPRNIRLAESPSFGKPICLYEPNSAGAQAYRLLTAELTMRFGLEQAKSHDPALISIRQSAGK
jgi:chromosome partitioning protein